MKLSTLSMMGRLILAAFLAALGEFCVFGFCASFEPGGSVWFRVLYSELAVVFLGGAIFMALSPLASRKAARASALIGLVGGGAAAFVLVYILALSGPRGDTPWPFGISYALLAAPPGAILGGALGAFIGLWRKNE